MLSPEVLSVIETGLDQLVTGLKIEQKKKKRTIKTTVRNPNLPSSILEVLELETNTLSSAFTALQRALFERMESTAESGLASLHLKPSAPVNGPSPASVEILLAGLLEKVDGVLGKTRHSTVTRGPATHEKALVVIYKALESATIHRLRCIGRHRNTLVPCSKLPTELLLHIIWLSLNPKYQYYEELGSMRLVCAHWCQLIDAYPSFWNVLRNRMSQAGMRMALEKCVSPTVSLNVSYVLYKGPRDESFVKAVQPYRERWSVLDVECEDLLQVPSDLFAKPAPRLRELSVDTSSHRGTIVGLFGGEGGAPNLESVVLKACSIQWSSGVLKGLRRLSLYHIVGGRPSTSQILEVLKACPDLEHLVLLAVKFQDVVEDVDAVINNEFPGAVVPMHQLASIHLDDLSSVPFLHLLRRIQTSPRLQRFLCKSPNMLELYAMDVLGYCEEGVAANIRHTIASTRPNHLHFTVTLSSISISSDDDALSFSWSTLHDAYACTLRLLRLIGADVLAQVPISLTLTDYTSLREVWEPEEPDSRESWVEQAAPYLTSVTGLALKCLPRPAGRSMILPPVSASGVVRRLCGMGGPADGEEETGPQGRTIFPNLDTLIIACCPYAAEELHELVKRRTGGVGHSSDDAGEQRTTSVRGVVSLLRLHITGGNIKPFVLEEMKVMMSERHGKIRYLRLRERKAVDNNRNRGRTPSESDEEREDEDQVQVQAEIEDGWAMTLDDAVMNESEDDDEVDSDETASSATGYGTNEEGGEGDEEMSDSNDEWVRPKSYPGSEFSE